MRTFGNAEQKQRFLPGLADGSRLSAFALTEPGAGSDLTALQTTARLDGEGWLPLPDFDADPQAWNVRSWTMAAGDCVAFNARLFHGGSGKLPAGRGLRVFNTKWLGDDVRVAFRPYGMDPDHSEKMKAGGMAHGDPIEGGCAERLREAVRRLGGVL